ncbi:uncharacterized protein l(2)k09913 isoform X2 [Dermacentor albipictus]|uniref:uncharacterized protein l(2)k09913 isoform X2 n=1 Tax=Dermacentor albipictus TaxID=60249 RepID=UPI0031FBC3CF
MMALRGLRVVARIVGAPGKQTGLGSACKVLVPCLSLQSMSMAVRTETLNQNMQLRLSDKPPPTAGAPLVGGGGGGQGVVCPVLTSSSSARPDEVMGHRGVSSSSSNSALRENPLTVLLAWMNARDKHLQNYHDFYLQLGFDVLTVRTLPLQLAFPTSGAQVYDSLVDYEGIPKGFPTALTRNPVVCKVLELMIHLQRLVLYPLSTVHWKASSRAFHENPLTCPALMINSKRDQVASIEDNLRVANQWRQRGTDVTFCTFDDSKHVQHMGLYPDLYCGEVLRLLRKAQLIA